MVVCCPLGSCTLGITGDRNKNTFNDTQKQTCSHSHILTHNHMNTVSHILIHTPIHSLRHTYLHLHLDIIFMSQFSLCPSQTHTHGLVVCGPTLSSGAGLCVTGVHTGGSGLGPTPLISIGVQVCVHTGHPPLPHPSPTAPRALQTGEGGKGEQKDSFKWKK